jgi:hypothetical protein
MSNISTSVKTKKLNAFFLGILRALNLAKFHQRGFKSSSIGLNLLKRAEVGGPGNTQMIHYSHR